MNAPSHPPPSCSCTRCVARAASNVAKAEKILDEVRRHVSAWAGVDIIGPEFQYVPARPAWLATHERFPHFKIVIRVEFNATDVAIVCADGGPTTLLVALGEAADRDIIAWIHNTMMDSFFGLIVSDGGSDHSRPNPGLT